MNLFLFLLKKKVSYYLSLNNWKTWVLDSAIFISYLFISYNFCLLYDLKNENSEILNRDSLISFLYISIYIAPMLIKFFLSRLDKEFIISEHYPIKKFTLSIIDFLVFGFFIVISCFNLGIVSKNFCTSLNCLVFNCSINSVNSFLV